MAHAVVVSGTDLIIDINGYFTYEYNPGKYLFAVSADVSPAIVGLNTSTVGLAFGVASHGIGTARALQISETAGAFSALGFALNAVATSLMLPVVSSLIC